MSEPPRALRISQIDAEELDDGLVGMLASKLESALGLFSPSTSSAFTPEIHLSLKFLIYRLGVMANATNRASPGMRLQNIKYVDGGTRGALSPRQIYLLPLITLLPPYLISCLHQTLSSRSYPESPRGSWKHRFWRVLENLQWVGKVWEVAGLMGFLVDGSYPSLQSRALQILRIPADDSGNVTRSISYEFMNRQLVWTGVTEFLLCILPFLRAHHHFLTRPIRRRITRLRQLLRLVSSRNLAHLDYGRSRSDVVGTSSEQFTNGSREKDGAGMYRQGAQKAKQRKRQQGPLWRLPKETCAICHRRLHGGIDKTLGLPAIDLDGLESHQQDSEDIMDRGVGKADDTEVDDETRIHIPARAGCERNCTYCHHCIAEALIRQTSLVEKQAELSRYQDVAEEDRVGGWPCLRCGEEVWTCQRVG